MQLQTHCLTGLAVMLRVCCVVHAFGKLFVFLPTNKSSSRHTITVFRHHEPCHMVQLRPSQAPLCKGLHVADEVFDRRKLSHLAL